MKKILTLFVALLICLPALSRPAFPGIIKAVQPDGSIILLRIHGDEFYALKVGFDHTVDGVVTAASDSDDLYDHVASGGLFVFK